ncbi:uncharacterized protein BCR38DRAFT_525695 [Pseudomassariella vexata]|uniref:HECT-type E3 ubiquitin transferase n=1 Tax=Pseudomassariella vexata TaxID=1141098 RepID=A0A1Y2DPY3_9PEZI|nr:uncharacterized protein BCR38DRAFT_525695 [Pseudomassariella vexata]ORY61267.1 hypothetical protein BCR38DRAFT_525695 [Pseudomassariella vexata]
MTRDAARQADVGHSHTNPEADLVAALWEEVPFPRLPFDAPAELKELVVEVENPKRVYQVHRASRRHNFQLLVEKFILQLRYGCDYDSCPTPSCFKCRKRLAGKAPIRRYSPSSARTLAIYMASQDNAESRMCPYLQTPQGPSDAIKPLIFGPSGRVTKEPREGHAFKQVNGHARSGSPGQKDAPRVKPRVSRAGNKDASEAHNRNNSAISRDSQPSSLSSLAPQISIRERPASKDYRSFAANVFGTVAFKMLEWLTPNNMEAISNDAYKAAHQQEIVDSDADDAEDSLFLPSATSAPSSVDNEQENTPDSSIRPERSPSETPNQGPDVDGIGKSPDRGFDNSTSDPSVEIRPGHTRKHSSNRLRTSSISKPQIKVPKEHFSDAHPDDARLISPRISLLEQATKSLMSRSSSNVSRRSSDDKLPKIVSGEQPVEADEALNADDQKHELDGVNGGDASSVGETLPSVYTPNELGASNLDNQASSSTPELDDLLPQSLCRLSFPAINLLCDILQEDGTAENHLFESPTVSGILKRSPMKSKPWKRQRKVERPYPRNLKLEWKLFVEQSIFNVLSDPQAILDSFTSHRGLVDSQSLWYCMLRMTRVAPSVVFDSLWVASASLFAPPKALQSSRSPTAKVFPTQGRSLTNKEAGFILAVCFHALVAAAPFVTDSRQLLDMSRIRSRGLILAESGGVARQSSRLCLLYQDAFSDDMALRLARRLLAAIPTRRYFDELIEHDLDSNDEEGSAEPDVLDTLLDHLEYSPPTETTPSLNFSHAEREMHEKRIPILMLDWARAVMLNDWEGRPDVSGDGSFGGALCLIAAMHRKKNSLLLADVAFRAEYFGDRLDPIEVPVSWLAFNSTRRKVHLLDYPYIFHPSSLVSYFRAINFSRMSRSYEESSSLQSRIRAIIEPESLVTDLHQKSVLQDLLKTPSAKFLILDIGRKTVIRDAFDQLWRREKRELMRPLKVHLGEDSGEEGFDSGGVQQEFFRLAIAEALNPDYGAFTIDERTRMTWFQPGSLQPEWKFELIGLLISLAVYNGLTLPITFPKALYQKLLGEPVTELHHIADGWPDLANGLTTLLEWDEKDGAVEDVFARTYEFSISMFGQPVSRQMEGSKGTPWPQFSRHPAADSLASSNPDDAPLVTGDNRNAYVSDYIRYLTDISIAPQFAAFARGFRTCLRPKSLRLLTPSLLQSIVEGTQEIDIADLRRATRYVSWDANHRTVRDFWSIVKRYDDRMKRKLLEFVTASDRVPVGGMRNVQFVVQKNGEEEGEDGHLPTAYTCYGTLLLPEYRDKEVLRERLAMALENAQGFGFA